MTVYIRFTIDGAVPQDVYNALPSATRTAIRDRFRQVKAICRKINAGLPNEEASIRFKWHVCHHEDGQPCEEEQDI